MRKPLFGWLAACGLAVGCFTGTASAQGFQAVYSKDGTDVWAVGDAGLVHRSFDGGAGWTSQTVGAATLRGVAHRGLVVITVGDGGEVRRSTDNGGTFALQSLGAGALRGIEMADASTGWIVGDGGVIHKTVDGGATWAPQVSGTPADLAAVRFRDTSEGWAVGAGGTVLHTVDGGSNWTPVAVGTGKDLRSVDFIGTTVWVVGNDATAVKTDNGVMWSTINLKIDALSDITGVWVESANNVTLTGGGGFCRKSLDGGSTWLFYKNPVLAPTTDVHFTNGGTKGWMTHAANKAVCRSTDSGISWTYAGTGSRSWSLKQATETGTIRGNTLCQSHVNKNTFFVVLGLRVYRSTNRGETWTQIGTISGGGSKTNAFYVHPADDNLMVAAVGAPDRIMRSTNGGGAWTQTKAVDFTEYGVPLEMNQDNPNHLIFGPEDGQLHVSNDFGATWSVLSNPGFRSPCDIQIVQDNNSVIWVGDGVTGSGSGQMFRSTNGGLNFSLVYTTSGSEIPMIGAPHLAPSTGLATHWSSGGVRRTTDMGASWQQVHTAGSAWGTDYAKDDPLVCVFGVYSGGQSYVSLDAGASGTFVATSLGGTNYAFHAPDRATVLAMQAAGVYKMVNTYTVTPNNTQSVAVVSPNGGEVWTAGEARNITWTGSNLGLVSIEYRPNAASAWQQVALVEGLAGSYGWTVPGDATTQAEVRVSDGWDASPVDGSNAVFTIQAPIVAAQAPTLDFGPHGVGTQTNSDVTLLNTGTAAFNGTVAVVGDGFTLVSSSNVSIPAASQANVTVQFSPSAAAMYTGTLTLTGNAPQVNVALAGEGTQAAALQLNVPNGGETWQFGTVQEIRWASVVVGLVRIEYQTGPMNPWQLIADNVPADGSAYAWTVPYSPSATVRVRLLEVGGGLIDGSDSDFALTAPFFSASTSSIDFGSVNINTPAQHMLHISNPGSAPLVIGSITDDSPEVALDQSSMIIPVSGGADLGVTYTPSAPGPDTATITFVDDAPGSPHTVGVIGEGQTPSDAGGIPTVYALDRGGPNPFVGETFIRYRLPQASAVTLDVYDLKGHRVARLVNGEQAPGEYQVAFGRGVVTGAGDRIGDLAAGVYFVRLQAGTFSKTAKLVLAQ
jgi:photosystem II stability/assembly factor-like uncharacterized protein